jgi:hypothetical protein
MITPDLLSVVLQGPLQTDRSAVDALNERLRSVRLHLPGAAVIVSTCSPMDDTACIDADRVVRCEDPGALPPYKQGSKANNINRQIASTRAGLAQVITPFALKLRTDTTLSSGGLLHAYATWQRAPGLHARAIAVGGRFTLDPRAFERLPFHFSDVVQLGRTADLRKLWAAPYMTQADAEHFDHHAHGCGANVLERRYRARLAAEQWLWTHYAAALGYPTPSQLTDRRASVLQAHDEFLARDLIVVSVEHCGVQVPTLQWASRSGLQRFNCIDHLDWLAHRHEQGWVGTGEVTTSAMLRRRMRVRRFIRRAAQCTQASWPVLVRPPVKPVLSRLLRMADRISRLRCEAVIANPPSTSRRATSC